MPTPLPDADLDLAQLKALDALTVANGYDDATFAALLPHVNAARLAARRLRSMALGEVHSPYVMQAGGER